MIFYFSGTGNSKWAAKYVAEATADRLLYIPDEMRGDMTYTLQAGERLGFVIPVHGWRPPVLVRNFLSKCQFVATGPVYTYLVYTAGDSIGKGTEMFEADLAPHGLTLSAALSLIMPESYVGLPFMDVDKPEKERAKKQRATTELNEREFLGRRLTVNEARPKPQYAGGGGGGRGGYGGGGGGGNRRREPRW